MLATLLALVPLVILERSEGSGRGWRRRNSRERHGLPRRGKILRCAQGWREVRTPKAPLAHLKPCFTDLVLLRGCLRAFVSSWFNSASSILVGSLQFDPR